jgi:hypothetical protein
MDRPPEAGALHFARLEHGEQEDDVCRLAHACSLLGGCQLGGNLD